MDIEALRRANNAAIERVQHTHDNCTGSWRVKLRLMGMTIECTGCGVTYPCDADIAHAALDENAAGLRMAVLADQGARLLQAGGHDARRNR